MANESLVWKRLRKMLKADPDVTHLQRHEPNMPEGLPDVHFIIREVPGWIELKDLDDWPKRESTPLRIKHFSQKQRIWLHAYGMSNGRAFIIVHFGDECFLYDWRASFSLGEWSQGEMRKHCLMVWKDKEAPAYTQAAVEILTTVIPRKPLYAPFNPISI